MKIAIIGFSQNPYFHVKTLGGAELTERNHLRLLSEAGHEIHHLTQCDSENCLFENVTQYKTTVPSKNTDAGRALGNKRNKLRNAELANLLTIIQPDVIINHDDSNQSVLKLLTAHRFAPSFSMIHSSLSVSGGPGIIGYMQALIDYANSGGTVVCVSDVSRKEWNDQIAKSSKKWLTGILEIEDFLYPAILWELPDNSPQKRRGFISIGRLDKIKNFHWAIKAIGGALTIFTTTPKNDNEREEYERLKPLGAKFEFDVPYAQIMDRIESSSAVVICGHESFGLTAVEANIHGAPVILCTTKEHHPVEEACKLDTNYVKCNPKELAGIVNHWESGESIDYLSISRSCWAWYNHAKATIALEKMIDIAIARFIPQEFGLDAFTD